MSAPSRPWPAVSVVVAFVRPESTDLELRATLESLTGQTFGAWECLIAVGPDPSRALQARSVLQGGDVRLVPVASSDLGEARNAAVRASRGRYLLAMDPGDRLAATMLEETVAVLEAEPSCSVATTETRVGAEGPVLPVGPFELTAELAEPCLPDVALFRRSLWDAVGGYDGALGEAMGSGLWVAALARGLRGRHIAEPLVMLGRPRQVAPGTRPRPRGPAQPTVSVIVPTRDRPRLLEAALRSILAQTFQDFEIVVVNDGGAPVDDVIARLDDGTKVQSVRSARTRGLAGARNLALRVARGRYIAYLDDDDLFYPDHLQTLVDALADGGAEVAYSDAVRVLQKNEGGRVVEVGRDRTFSFEFDPDRLLVMNLMPVLAVMHERRCLDEAGGFDESLGVTEDWDLWIRLSRRYRFRHVPRVTCEFMWRVDGASMTGERRPLFFYTEELLAQRYRDEIAASPRARGFLYEHRFKAQVQPLIADGRLEAAIAALERVVARDPELAQPRADLAALRAAAGRGGAPALPRYEGALREAEVLLDAGRPDQAARALEQVMATRPGDPGVMAMAGDISRAVNRPDDARAFYQAALRIDARHPSALAGLAALNRPAGRPNVAGSGRP